jgi:hypothetical protein
VDDSGPLATLAEFANAQAGVADVFIRPAQ